MNANCINTNESFVGVFVILDGQDMALLVTVFHFVCVFEILLVFNI